MRVLARRLQLHQIHNIDHPDFQFGQMLAQDGNGGQNLQRRCVSATGHHYVRFGGSLVVAGPLPDANSLCAMHHRLVHGQPLREGVFARHHDVDVIPAAQAVIENRQQAVGVGRKVNPHDVRFLVDDMVEKTRILMRESVVVLLPDVRGEQIV